AAPVQCADLLVAPESCLPAAGLRPFCTARRTGLDPDRLPSGRRCERSCSLSEESRLAQQRPLDCSRQVPDQVPAVSHLDGARRAAPGSFAVDTRAIARDHLHTGVTLEPSGKRICTPVW